MRSLRKSLTVKILPLFFLLAPLVCAQTQITGPTVITGSPLPPGVSGDGSNGIKVTGSVTASTVAAGATISSVNRRINVAAPPYNAVGDGSTPDYTAINNALSALMAAGGGTLVFPQTPHSYFLGANTLTVTTGNVTLEGDGPGASIISCNGNVPCVWANGATNFGIRNLGITNNFAQPTTTYSANFKALQLSSVNNATIENVSISNSFSGITLFGGSHLKFHKITENGNYVLAFDGNADGTNTPTTDLQIDGISINGTHDWGDIPNATYTGSAHDFELTDTADFHILNAVVTDDGTLGQYAPGTSTSCFQFGPAYSPTVQNSTLHISCNNSVNNPNVSGVVFGGGYSTTATVTVGSNQITVASATSLRVGQVVIYSGFPIGTTVTNISGTTVTLSQNALSGGGSGVTVVFSGVYQNILLDLNLTGYKNGVTSSSIYAGMTNNFQITGRVIYGSQSLFGAVIAGPLTTATNDQDIAFNNFSVTCAGTNAVTASPTNAGIYLKLVNGIKIRGGGAYNCAHEGLVVTGSSGNNIAGFIVKNASQTTAGTYYGIRVQSFSGINSNNNAFTAPQFQDNQATPTLTHGFYAPDGTGNLLNSANADTSVATPVVSCGAVCLTGIGNSFATPTNAVGSSSVVGSSGYADMCYANDGTNYSCLRTEPYGTTAFRIRPNYAGTYTTATDLILAGASVFIGSNNSINKSAGWQFTSGQAQLCLVDGACSIGTSTNYRPAYIYASTGVYGQAHVSTGAAITAPTGISYGGTTTAASNCGSLSGAAGCILVNINGTAHYVPYW